ncbi:MAG: GntR family transcriptional regulator [Thermoplasmataceae archaeon]
MEKGLFIKVEFNSDIPLYQQIRDQIVEAIANGSLREGQIIPSARAMAKNLEINYHTVNKAYNILTLEGFISMNSKKQLLVLPASGAQVKRFLDDWSSVEISLINEARAMGFQPDKIMELLKKLVFSGKTGDQIT